MQFLARSLSKSIRPSLNSTAKKSWVLSQHCHSTSYAKNSSSTLGGSRAEKSSEEWPRPTEVPYQPKIANSIDLIGYVHQPVQFDSTIDGNFWAGTVISHEPSSDSKSESDSSSNFWLVFATLLDLRVFACWSIVVFELGIGLKFKTLILNLVGFDSQLF